MFQELVDTKDVGKAISGLSQDSWMGIAQTGIIIGFLKVSMWITKIEGSTNLFNINGLEYDYYYWDDFFSLVHKEIKDLNINPDIDKRKWMEEVIKFGSQKRLGYCTCLALLLERHLKNSYGSPNNAQEKAMQQINQILAGELNTPDALSEPKDQGDRIDYYVTLHAADKPVIQINFTQAALMKYSDKLEGLMEYSVMNIIKKSLRVLKEPYRTHLEDLVFNEHLTWQNELPKTGAPYEWNWLPRFA